MVTLRRELTDAGYDWESGIIIIKETGSNSSWPGWEPQGRGIIINDNDPILDKEYNEGYGGPEAPAFVAEDSESMYFPYQYDGSTGIVSVYKNIHRYLEEDTPTPYPGG